MPESVLMYCQTLISTFNLAAGPINYQSYPFVLSVATHMETKIAGALDPAPKFVICTCALTVQNYLYCDCSTNIQLYVFLVHLVLHRDNCHKVESVMWQYISRKSCEQAQTIFVLLLQKVHPLHSRKSYTVDRLTGSQTLTPWVFNPPQVKIHLSTLSEDWNIVDSEFKPQCEWFFGSFVATLASKA